MVTEDEKKAYMSGWHVAANFEEYMDFQKQYIAAISKELEEEGISEYTYFHIFEEHRILMKMLIVCYVGIIG